MSLTSVKKISERRAALGEFPEDWRMPFIRGKKSLWLSTGNYTYLEGKMINAIDWDDYYIVPDNLKKHRLHYSRATMIRFGLLLFVHSLYGLTWIVNFFVLLSFIGDKQCWLVIVSISVFALLLSLAALASKYDLNGKILTVDEARYR